MPTRNDLAEARKSMWRLLAAGEDAEAVVAETVGPAGLAAFRIMRELVATITEHAELQGCSCGSPEWLEEQSRSS